MKTYYVCDISTGYPISGQPSKGYNTPMQVVQRAQREVSCLSQLFGLSEKDVATEFYIIDNTFNEIKELTQSI